MSDALERANPIHGVKLEMLISMVHAMSKRIKKLMSSDAMSLQGSEESTVEQVDRHRDACSPQSPGNRLEVTQGLKDLPRSPAKAEAKGLGHPHASRFAPMRMKLLQKGSLQKKLNPQFASAQHDSSACSPSSGTANICTPTVRHITEKQRIARVACYNPPPLLLSCTTKNMRKTMACRKLRFTQHSRGSGISPNQFDQSTGLHEKTTEIQYRTLACTGTKTATEKHDLKGCRAEETDTCCVM